MTFAQRSPNANQAGIENFIYGQASSMLLQDVQVLAIATVIFIALILLFWKELKIFVFDPEYTKTLGFNTRFLRLLISTIMVITIILGLESVGVILMSALLVGPAVAARQWTNRLEVMVALAGILGLFSGVIGTLISSMYEQIPTGPTIVVVLSVFIIISLLFAPQRGILARKRAHRLRQKKYAEILDKQVTR